MLLATVPCLLSLLLVPAPAPRAALLGPPAVCHPIAIGDAASLPWKGGGFGRDPGYDINSVVNDTLALLDASNAAFVHMETLRRAVIYLGDAEGASAGAHDKAWRQAETRRLVAALESRTAVAAPAALAWFDLGYGRVALSQMGLPIDVPAPVATSAAPATAAASAANAAGTSSAPGTTDAAAAKPPRTAAELVRVPLEKAAALAPDDGAVQLGLAIAYFDGPARNESACLDHLDRALALADDPNGLLNVNVLGTMGKFYGAATHEDLVAAVAARRQRG